MGISAAVAGRVFNDNIVTKTGIAMTVQDNRAVVD